MYLSEELASIKVHQCPVNSWHARIDFILGVRRDRIHVGWSIRAGGKEIFIRVSRENPNFPRHVSRLAVFKVSTKKTEMESAGTSCSPEVWRTFQRAWVGGNQSAEVKFPRYRGLVRSGKTVLVYSSLTNGSKISDILLGSNVTTTRSIMYSREAWTSKIIRR